MVSRGWYRIEPGKCLHPDVHGQPDRIFSFAEAVDADDRTIMLQGQAAELGRRTSALHAREQIRDQPIQGLRSARPRLRPDLPPIDLGGKAATVVRFKEP